MAGPALRDAGVWSEACAELDRAEQTRLAPAGPERDAAAIARMETRMYLQSQLLRDLDVMSMAHGLEVRVPFVDHELVAAVWPDLGRRALATQVLQPAHHTTAATGADVRVNACVSTRPS